MIHELKAIIEQGYHHFRNGKKNVLATIVELEGSSYRGPGTRMLLADDGSMMYALSGGCIEMEVQMHAEPVFETGLPKLIAYDGRKRLGCEGVIYILLEPFEMNEQRYDIMMLHLQQRKDLVLTSFYQNQHLATGNFGTTVELLPGKTMQFSEQFDRKKAEAEGLKTYQQMLGAPFRLMIFGGGHDVNAMTNIALQLGWEVQVVICMKSPRVAEDFPMATSVTRASGDMLQLDRIDENTAAIVMTHNFDMDLDYVLGLQKSNVGYLGVIGSTKRRERLKKLLSEHQVPFDNMDKIHSPAGLNIGAITPEEIAISVISEVLYVIREKEPSLNFTMGNNQ